MLSWNQTCHIAMKYFTRQVSGAAELAILLLPSAMAATQRPLRIIDIAQVPASNGRQLTGIVGDSSAPLQALEGASVLLVRYLDSVKTPVTSEEYKDRELVNHHIVYEVSSLGDINAEHAPKRGYSCADTGGMLCCDRAERCRFARVCGG